MTKKSVVLLRFPFLTLHTSAFHLLLSLFILLPPSSPIRRSPSSFPILHSHSLLSSLIFSASPSSFSCLSPSSPSSFSSQHLSIFLYTLPPPPPAFSHSLSPSSTSPTIFIASLATTLHLFFLVPSPFSHSCSLPFSLSPQCSHFHLPGLYISLLLHISPGSSPLPAGRVRISQPLPPENSTLTLIEPWEEAGIWKSV